MVRAAQLAPFSRSGRSPAEGRLADQIRRIGCWARPARAATAGSVP